MLEVPHTSAQSVSRRYTTRIRRLGIVDWHQRGCLPAMQCRAPAGLRYAGRSCGRPDGALPCPATARAASRADADPGCARQRGACCARFDHFARAWRPGAHRDDRQAGRGLRPQRGRVDTLESSRGRERSVLRRDVRSRRTLSRALLRLAVSPATLTPSGPAAGGRAEAQHRRRHRRATDAH